MNEITNFIKPELLILVPVLLLIGGALKKSEYVPDKRIPLLLGCISIAVAVIWVLATCELISLQSVFMALFTAITQGVLCAGTTVYANQVWKQKNK